MSAIRRLAGVPHIDHPNFGWAIAQANLEAVHDYRLFEIFNGHPEVNNAGGADAPGLEQMWDRLLSAGKLVYGIAVDDAHHFKRPGDADASGPGRGSIVVRARTLTADAILGAMELGQFYASTGVELDDVVATDAELHIRVRTRGTTKLRVLFIGDGGRVPLPGAVWSRRDLSLHGQRALRPCPCRGLERPHRVGATRIRPRRSLPGAQ